MHHLIPNKRCLLRSREGGCDHGEMLLNLAGVVEGMCEHQLPPSHVPLV